jgi:hypothetical protein
MCISSMRRQALVVPSSIRRVACTSLPARYVHHPEAFLAALPKPASELIPVFERALTRRADPKILRGLDADGSDSEVGRARGCASPLSPPLPGSAVTLGECDAIGVALPLYCLALTAVFARRVTSCAALTRLSCA